MKKTILLIAAAFFTFFTACSADRVSQYDIQEGSMKKGGLGYILTAEEGGSFLALRDTQKVYTDRVVFNARLKAVQDSGIRNGFIRMEDQNGNFIQCGVYIGAGTFFLGGSAVEGKRLDLKFDREKVFDLEVTVDLIKGEVEAVIDGEKLTRKIKGALEGIERVGYSGNNTSTEFSRIEEIVK